MSTATREQLELSVRVMHTCKTCRRVGRVDYLKSFTRHQNGVGTIVKSHPRWTVHGVVVPGDNFGPNRFCSTCRKCMRADIIIGRKSDTPCSTACTSARGHDCECSCAGTNHGIDHAPQGGAS